MTAQLRNLSVINPLMTADHNLWFLRLVISIKNNLRIAQYIESSFEILTVCDFKLKSFRKKKLFPDTETFCTKKKYRLKMETKQNLKIMTIWIKSCLEC